MKKAVLLSFRIHDNQVIEGAESRYFDKVPMKFADYDQARFEREGFRVVPPAAVRQGAYIAKNSVLMPSYVNIGAYIDEGTMVDTWATVGSCAQIGKMCIYPAELVLVAYLNHYKLTQPSLKTTALLAPVQKLLKALLLKKGLSFQWGFILVKAQKFMTAKLVRSTMDVCQRALWLYRVICHRKTVATAFIVP